MENKRIEANFLYINSETAFETPAVFSLELSADGALGVFLAFEVRLIF